MPTAIRMRREGSPRTGKITRWRLTFRRNWKRRLRPNIVRGVLAHDPRPSYQSDPERLYGVAFAEKNVRFTVRDGVLTVREIEPLKEE